MLPGNHLMRTTYGPGLLGSPNSTACSFVPAAFRTHAMSDGVLKSTEVRSMSAAWADGAASATTRRASASMVIGGATSSTAEPSTDRWLLRSPLGRVMLRVSKGASHVTGVLCHRRRRSGRGMSRRGRPRAAAVATAVRDGEGRGHGQRLHLPRDRKSTRLNSSHLVISYAVFCLKKKKNNNKHD